MVDFDCEERGQTPVSVGGADSKAKAPNSPKFGALPFSLSSHKENQ
jgi:hypothetical protein